MSIFDDNIIESNPITAQSVADLVNTRKDEDMSDTHKVIDKRIDAILHYIYWYVMGHFGNNSITIGNGIKVYLSQFGEIDEVIKHLNYIKEQFTSRGFSINEYENPELRADTEPRYIIISWEHLVDDYDDVWKIIQNYMNISPVLSFDHYSRSPWLLDSGGIFCEPSSIQIQSKQTLDDLTN